MDSDKTRPKLSVVPEPEPEAEGTTETPKAYTMRDLYRDNVKLVEETAGVELTPEAAVNLFAVTLNYQLQKIGMGLSQPTEA